VALVDVDIPIGAGYAALADMDFSGIGAGHGWLQ
jgi:hypothetical protein